MDRFVNRDFKSEKSRSNAQSAKRKPFDDKEYDLTKRRPPDKLVRRRATVMKCTVCCTQLDQDRKKNKFHFAVSMLTAANLYDET